MEEKEIIAQCRAGHVDAYAELVRQYQTRLIVLAWNIVGNRDDAQDIAQDALIKAYLNLDRFNPELSFKTWIFAITTRTCIDFLRKKKSFLNFFRHESAQKEHFLVNPPHYETIEESLVFHRLLQKIGQKERTAISLRVNENYSAKEIAAVLGCSECTARAHLLHARRKLKKELEKLNSHDPARLAKETP